VLSCRVSRRNTPSPLKLLARYPTRHAHPHHDFSSCPCTSRAITPAQIQPFLHFVRPNSPRINTSKKISISHISLIPIHLNPTRINTSKNKDLKPRRINTSGHKDLKSRRINTSKKHGRGEGSTRCTLNLYFNYAKKPSTISPAPVCDSAANCSRLAVAVGTLHSLAAPQPAVRRSLGEGGWRRRAAGRQPRGGNEATCSS
jgi:hypothetical protein